MPIKLKPISQQVIVITGASSGNGLATAQEAVRRGARVVLASRNAAALDTIACELQSRGGQVCVVTADVSIEADVERIAQAAIAHFGGFDSWVNNAGAGVYGTVEEVPLADHARIFAVNYFGTLHGCLVAARILRGRGGGAIVNIGSILSDRAINFQGPYSATKHAVLGLTEALRTELEQERAGISVTLIKPGGCGTPYAEHARNYMDAPPRIPQPLYDPMVVADAILLACEKPRRIIYVGSGALAASFISNAMPRLTDLVIEALGSRIQRSPQNPGDRAMRDNLYEPRKDGVVHTTQNLKMRKSSLLVKAQKRPRAMWVASAIGIACSLLVGGSRKQRP